MALADSGVTDPQELRRRTLENFDFKPPVCTENLNSDVVVMEAAEEWM